MDAARRRFQISRFALAVSLMSVLVLLPSCGPDPSEDVRAIGGLLAKEVDAINAKDLQGLSQIWSQEPEILLFDVPPPGRYQGWDQVARSFKAFFDRFTDLQLTIDTVQIKAEGDLGYATYGWTLRGKMGEYDLVDRGQATAIYRREDRGWRLVHAHFSPVPAAVAAQGGGDPPAGDPVPEPDASPSIPPGAPAGDAENETPDGPRSAVSTGQDTPMV